MNQNTNNSLRHAEYPPRTCSRCDFTNYSPIDTEDCRQCKSPLGKIDYEWLKKQLGDSVNG